MKYKIKLLVLLVISFSLGTLNVLADASIKASSGSITKGGTVTITATISSGTPLVSTEGSLSCSGAGVNGGKDLNWDDGSNSIYSKSFSYTAKATTTGTITCTLDNARYLDMGSVAWQSASANTLTIKVTEPVVVAPKQLSADNDLKSLNVDGQEITPAFSKDTLEYKLIVDEVVTSIKINAIANDSKANISGIGEVNLSNGENTFEIKVIAENGNEKIYKLIVVVEDQHPIEVKVDKNDLTLVKKNNDLIELLDDYEETTIKLQEQDVVAYYNDKTKVTLVLLKDKDNNIGYYIYNKKENTYEKYRYVIVGNVNLQLLDVKNVKEHFKKYSLKLQNQKIDYYKIKASHKVGLIYGTNVKTGNTGYYVYDQSENTLSKYYEEEIKLYNKDNQTLKNYLMIFIGLVALIMIVVIVISLKKTMTKRKNKYV